MSRSLPFQIKTEPLTNAEQTRLTSALESDLSGQVEAIRNVSGELLANGSARGDLRDPDLIPPDHDLHLAALPGGLHGRRPSGRS